MSINGKLLSRMTFLWFVERYDGTVGLTNIAIMVVIHRKATLPDRGGTDLGEQVGLMTYTARKLINRPKA
jgi:hypothetical protein